MTVDSGSFFLPIRQRYASGGMLISLGLATAVSGHLPRK
jgi:hypothetical protein